MNATYEDNFWDTLWHFLPGIVKFFSVIAIVGLIFNGISLFGNSNSNVAGTETRVDGTIIRTFNTSSGNPDSSVKYVYFVDYQCPACASNDSNMDRLKDQYSSNVYFVYKHFPLESIHAYAESAAKAVQAAGKQGKYFEYGSQIMQTQNSLSPDHLVRVAQNLNLDIDKWNADRNSTAIDTEVRTDKKDLTEESLPTSKTTGKVKPSGSLQDVGTPISIIYKNGEVYDWWTGGRPVDDVKAVLDAALKD